MHIEAVPIPDLAYYPMGKVILRDCHCYPFSRFSTVLQKQIIVYIKTVKGEQEH